MNGECSPNLLRDVAEILSASPSPLTPREVHIRLNRGARTTTRPALHELCRNGIAYREGDPAHYRYGRAAAPLSALPLRHATTLPTVPRDKPPTVPHLSRRPPNEEDAYDHVD